MTPVCHAPLQLCHHIAPVRSQSRAIRPVGSSRDRMISQMAYLSTYTRVYKNQRGAS
jgi:hypothetical protein